MRFLLLTAVIALSTLSTVSSYSEEWIESTAGWVTEDNVAYPGGDVEDWKDGDGWNKWSAMEDSEKTAEACRTLCSNTEGANFFTFRKASKNCWCKVNKGEIKGKEGRRNSRRGPEKNDDAVSGTTGTCQDYNGEDDPTMFRCADGYCRSRMFICKEGWGTCRDKSDKALCNAKCGHMEDRFYCGPKSDDDAEAYCIARSAICNGRKSCPDNSDESTATCGTDCGGMSGRFPCDDGTCIIESLERGRCNGKEECPDGSDESKAACGDDCGGNKDRFSCGDGKCINRWNWIDAKFRLCDGTNDCDNGKDEDCGDNCGGHDELFRCANGEKCILARKKCDGKAHCTDGSDEVAELCKEDCGGMMEAVVEGRNAHRFRCNDGTCILKANKCANYSWGDYRCKDKTGWDDCPTSED